MQQPSGERPPQGETARGLRTRRSSPKRSASSASSSARRHWWWVVQAGLVGVAAGVLAAVLTGWDPRQWRVYFVYEGDTFFNAMNGALANPLGLTNVSTRVGWPYGLNMTDFPAGEPIFTWLQWFCHLFVEDELTVLAAVWFLGFILVASTSYLVLRALSMGLWPSVAAALIYDFVPFHLWRATGHTNLALYMAVPLSGLVLLWLMAGRLDRPPRTDPSRPSLWRVPEWRVVAGCALVIGLSARYYAVFFLLLLALVTVIRMLSRGSWRVAWASLLAGGSVLAVALLTGIPQVIQRLQIGGNQEVAHRPRTDSDLYALRLTDLIAPIPGHRLPFLDHLGQAFRNTLVRGEEGLSLGFALLTGLALLIVVAVARRWPEKFGERAGTSRITLATNAAVLAAMCFLIGTVGGLGGAIASIGYTQIRSWNRISIFLSFFAAVGLALSLDWLWSLREARITWKRLLPLAITPLVVVLAVADQTAPATPTQTAVAAKRSSDRVFFNAMADDLGTGSAVFQLPYVAFPESGGLALDYMGFRGTLNDGGRLNYSYGGMRGRESDWQRSWVMTAPETQVVGLAAAGFSAVMVDRVGYTAENSIEPALQGLLGQARASSPDGRFAWYDLRPVRERLVKARGATWVQQTGARVVRPIGVQVIGDTYRSNGQGALDWGSLGARTRVELRRYDDDTNPVQLRFEVKVAPGFDVTATQGEWSQTTTATADPVQFAHEVAMTDRVADATVTTTAPNTAGPTDPRPDVRGNLNQVQVIDATLADQIARGELSIP